MKIILLVGALLSFNLYAVQGEIDADSSGTVKINDHFKIFKDGNVKGGYFCCGHTTPGGTGWKQYDTVETVRIDVDTSGCNFQNDPMYFTSLGGDGYHWVVTGVTSIYPCDFSPQNPCSLSNYSGLKDGFSIVLKGPCGGNYNALVETAQGENWHIQWCGLKEFKSGEDTGTY